MGVRSLILILTICLAGAAQACPDWSNDPPVELDRTTLTPTQTQWFETVYGASSWDFLRTATGRVLMAQKDLNNDGVPEICLEMATSATCSNGVMVCQFLVLRDWETPPIFSEYGHSLVIEDQITLGWLNLAMYSNASAGQVYRQRFDFEGKSYKNKGSDVVGSWSEKRCDDGAYRDLCLP